MGTAGLGLQREALLIEDSDEPSRMALAKRWEERRRKMVLGLAAFLFVALVAVVSLIVAIHHHRLASMRGPFGSRLRPNLVFEQDFEHVRGIDPSVWNVARTFEQGTQSFQYYTDHPSVLYLNESDGSLRIRPGLFSELGLMTTVPDHPPYLAEAVMRGNCQPLPDCATYRVPGCTSDPGSSGCIAIGGAGSAQGPTIIKPVTAAKLTTKGHFDFTYGRLEVRARLPAGDWVWPSLWLVPTEQNYGPWPLSGEIRLVEGRGNPPSFQLEGQPAGRDVVTSTLHYGENWVWNARGSLSAASVAGTSPHGGRPDFTQAYHTFGLFWNETSMYTYVLEERADGTIVEQPILDLTPKMPGGFFDGELGLKGPQPTSFRDLRERQPLPPAAPNPYKKGARNAPFDKPFYLVLSVAVGDMSHGCPNPQYFGPAAIWCRPCNNPTNPPPGSSAPASHSSGSQPPREVCGPPQTEFWERRGEWLPSWQQAKLEDRGSLAIKWIRVWQ